MSIRDYSKGQIYKLCCLDPNVKEIYVGSTLNFKNRKNTHKNDTLNSNCKGYNRKVYKYIRDNGSWNNWDMVLIKNYPCNDKKELHREEEKIRRELKASLNMVSAITDFENRKKVAKKYTEEHRQETNTRNKKRYELKKSEILKKQSEYQKRPEVKERNKIKVKCECGHTVRKSDLSRHKKSKIHLNFLHT